ncbi:MAG: peptidoglycan DD-metalloendopeptidase family protein [Gammaproteobacteria bacterium]
MNKHKARPLAETERQAVISAAVTSPLCILLLTLLFVTATRADEHSTEDKEIELEALRSQIRDTQSNIDEARVDVEAYLQELQKNEMASAEISANLDQLETSINDQLSTLEKLRQESDEQKQILETERGLLAEQIRVAYKTGRHDFLKLLLNQEDPDLIGRMLTYHDYYNKARADRIEDIRITLQNLQSLEVKIDQETAELTTLREQQLKRLDELTAYRDSRAAIIDQLESYISEQDRELQSLRRNEEELTELLDTLKQQQSVVELYEDIPPFDTLKGELQWPVEGRLLTRFGSARRDGRLKWGGVRIAANAGEDVRAVSTGKVIFADWFRNLGLLVIIDHGDGYMSLYGHNERLLKKPGDIVLAGEAISKVGDTGGQTESALYFEIRAQGTPVDPGLWCRS